MENKAKTAPVKTGRITSIDALRGFDMFWIKGGEGLIHSFYALLPVPFMAAIDAQFEHVEWAGFRFYDLIFPLFLFLVGVVLPFSMGRHAEEGAPEQVEFVIG